MEWFDSLFKLEIEKKNMEMQILHCNGANLLMFNRSKNLTGTCHCYQTFPGGLPFVTEPAGGKARRAPTFLSSLRSPDSEKLI
jgi:hypothetical protein